MPSSTSPKPAVCGHRGARGHLPENTLAGFAAAAAMGADGVELDVGMTRDGVVVVHHDPQLNRDITRDRHGRWLRADGPPLKDLDYATLQRYDVGGLRPHSDYARRFAQQREVPGARVPTLDAALDLLHAHELHVTIEIKSIPADAPLTAAPERLAAAVLTVLDARSALDHVRISSFDWRVLAEVLRLAPGVDVSCLTIESDEETTIARVADADASWTAGLRAADFDGSVARMVQALGASSWSPWYRNIDAATVAAARAAGLGVICWTANAQADLERMLGLGLDGIITDYPDRLRKLLASRRSA